RLQFGQVIGSPDGQHRDRHRDIGQDSDVDADVQIRGGVGEVRLDQPEHVDAAGKEHPDAKPDHLALVALQVTRQQQAERNDPVEDEVEGADRPPAAVDAVEVPGNLVGDIAGPDDEELGKAQIDVQHDEGEHQLTQVVLFRHAQ